MQFLLLLLGVVACSTSVIFIKKSGVDPVLLAAFRLSIAAVVLAPLFVRDLRRHRREMTWRHLLDSAIPGIALALHFVTWIIGARMTPAANSSLIVNLVPVVMPLFLWAFVRERLTWREVAATAVAACGFAGLMAADFRISGAHFRGDLVCFGSMLLFAAYMALARRYRHHPSVSLYIVPLYAAAAAASFAVSPWLAEFEPIDWAAEWPWVLALGIVPTVVGHSLLNNAMRHLRGQVVSLMVMSQFVFAGIFAYLVLHEIPDWTFYPASALLVVASAMAIKGR